MKTILILDDESSIVETMELLLSDKYKVKSFTDPDDVLVYLDAMPDISFVIIDWHVGKVDGVEFYKNEIKSRYPQMRGILVSAFYDQDQPSLVKADIKKHFVYNIEKPFDMLEFKKIVDRFVEP